MRLYHLGSKGSEGVSLELCLNDVGLKMITILVVR